MVGLEALPDAVPARPPLRALTAAEHRAALRRGAATLLRRPRARPEECGSEAAPGQRAGEAWTVRRCSCHLLRGAEYRGRDGAGQGALQPTVAAKAQDKRRRRVVSICDSARRREGLASMAGGRGAEQPCGRAQPRSPAPEARAPAASR